MTNRGTAQTMLFRCDRDRRRFLALLGQLEPDFGVAVLAYVLMGNHYHLIVRLERPEISEAMRFLDGSHSRAFNAEHERQGALFQGRYDARLLDSAVSLEAAGHYVHLNPVRAGLIENPADYRWSSMADHARSRTALRWLHLDLLGGRTGEEYLRAMAAANACGPESFATPNDDVALFDKWADEAVVERAFEKSDRAVAAALGVSIDELYIVVRGRANFARAVGIVHALQTTGSTASAVASRYGLRGRSGVYGAVRRLRRALDHDPCLQRLITGLDLTL